jgi:hypothetical protein
MRIIVKSRYNDERYFFTKVGQPNRWFVDLGECKYCRCLTDSDMNTTAIDPDGGPFISIETSLSVYNSNLPDIPIECIEWNEGARAYQLTK